MSYLRKKSSFMHLIGLKGLGHYSSLRHLDLSKALKFKAHQDSMSWSVPIVLWFRLGRSLGRISVLFFFKTFDCIIQTSYLDRKFLRNCWSNGVKLFGLFVWMHSVLQSYGHIESGRKHPSFYTLNWWFCHKIHWVFWENHANT